MIFFFATIFTSSSLKISVWDAIFGWKTGQMLCLSVEMEFAKIPRYFQNSIHLSGQSKNCKNIGIFKEVEEKAVGKIL